MSAQAQSAIDALLNSRRDRAIASDLFRAVREEVDRVNTHGPTVKEAVALLIDALNREGFTVTEGRQGFGCFDTHGRPHEFSMQISAAKR